MPRLSLQEQRSSYTPGIPFPSHSAFHNTAEVLSPCLRIGPFSALCVFARTLAEPLLQRHGDKFIKFHILHVSAFQFRYTILAAFHNLLAPHLRALKASQFCLSYALRLCMVDLQSAGIMFKAYYLYLAFLNRVEFWVPRDSITHIFWCDGQPRRFIVAHLAFKLYVNSGHERQGNLRWEGLSSNYYFHAI